MNQYIYDTSHEASSRIFHCISCWSPTMWVWDLPLVNSYSNHRSAWHSRDFTVWANDCLDTHAILYIAHSFIHLWLSVSYSNNWLFISVHLSVYYVDEVGIDERHFVIMIFSNFCCSQPYTLVTNTSHLATSHHHNWVCIICSDIENNFLWHLIWWLCYCLITVSQACMVLQVD